MHFVVVKENVFGVTVSHEGASDTVAVTVEQPSVEVTVAGIGVQGPKGEPGSSGDITFDHTQSSASATWTINHNLGFKPDVEVRNSGGQVVMAEVLHVSVNQTLIYFSSPTTGSAHFG